MAVEFKVRRRVAFSETDMGGIVHFPQFFRYMEDAEHAFFRALGLSVVTQVGDDFYGWPRVHVECDYEAPLRFEDIFEIHLTVKEVRSRSIAWGFVVVRPDLPDPCPIARGMMVSVCVRHLPDQPIAAVEIPQVIREKILAGPAKHSSDSAGGIG